MILVISGVRKVCLEFERSVELMLCIPFQLGSLLQASERLSAKYKLFLILHKHLTTSPGCAVGTKKPWHIDMNSDISSCH